MVPACHSQECQRRSWRRRLRNVYLVACIPRGGRLACRRREGAVRGHDRCGLANRRALDRLRASVRHEPVLPHVAILGSRSASEVASLQSSDAVTGPTSSDDRGARLQQCRHRWKHASPILDPTDYRGAHSCLATRAPPDLDEAAVAVACSSAHRHHTQIFLLRLASSDQDHHPPATHIIAHFGCLR
jgi:hypothetical protein